MTTDRRRARSTTTRIACRGLSEAQVWEVLRLTLLASGFRGSAASVIGAPSTFARSVRPWWVLPVAVLAVLPTAGLSLLLLTRRRCETCSVAMEDTHRGVTVHLHGTLPPGVLDALRAAVSGPRSGESGVEPVTAAVAARPSGRPVNPAMAAIVPPLPRPTALPGRPADRLHGLTEAPTSVPDDRTTVSDRTMVSDVRTTVPERAAARSVRLDLVTEQGRRISPGALAFVGRNPQIPPGAPTGHLILVEDLEISMSKTHFATGISDAGLWVRDLGSTNGTRVVHRDRAGRRLAPGETVQLAPGDRLQAGDRWFGVEAAVVDLAEETVAGW